MPREPGFDITALTNIGTISWSVDAVDATCHNAPGGKFRHLSWMRRSPGRGVQDLSPLRQNLKGLASRMKVRDD